MPLYTNHTRFPAIVTIQIESTSEPGAAIQIGQDPIYAKQKADKGWHDFQVDPGMTIEMSNGTVAVVLGVRMTG